MSEQSPISYGQFDGFLWIRCEGRGNFLCSPQLKSLAEQRIQAGERLVVIDLEVCTAMDSTFMGTLASIARKLLPVGGKLQIASASERLCASLEGLGLDVLMEINPKSAVWLDLAQECRSMLEIVGQERLAGVDQAKHVLDAHQTLGELNEHNANQFKNVVDCLSRDLEHAKGNE